MPTAQEVLDELGVIILPERKCLALQLAGTEWFFRLPIEVKRELITSSDLPDAFRQRLIDEVRRVPGICTDFILMVKAGCYLLHICICGEVHVVPLQLPRMVIIVRTSTDPFSDWPFPRGAFNRSRGSRWVF